MGKLRETGTGSAITGDPLFRSSSHGTSLSLSSLYPAHPDQADSGQNPAGLRAKCVARRNPALVFCSLYRSLAGIFCLHGWRKRIGK
jgi:hypothetical protein